MESRDLTSFTSLSILASLIIKRYLFDFTNMYATLFYYAFFKAPVRYRELCWRE